MPEPVVIIGPANRPAGPIGEPAEDAGRVAIHDTGLPPENKPKKRKGKKSMLLPALARLGSWIFGARGSRASHHREAGHERRPPLSPAFAGRRRLARDPGLDLVHPDGHTGAGNHPDIWWFVHRRAQGREEHGRHHDRRRRGKVRQLSPPRIPVFPKRDTLVTRRRSRRSRALPGTNPLPHQRLPRTKTRLFNLHRSREGQRSATNLSRPRKKPQPRPTWRR